MIKTDICSIVDRKEREYCEFSKDYVTDATIIINQLFGYGYVRFKSPLKIGVSIYEKDQIGHYYYDFGMEDKVSVDQRRNFFGKPTDDPFQIVLNTIKFDIEHALFHTDIDPNFSHTHWALRAILADRIAESMEWWDVDEAVNEEQLEFDFACTPTTQ